MKIRARELSVGARFWLRGKHYQVLELDMPIPGEGGTKLPWICRATDGSETILVYKHEKVWIRVPGPWEKVQAPDATKKGKHEHRWKLLLEGRARVCEVCGRGEELKGKSWRYRSGKR